MAVRDVLLFPDPRLNGTSQPVERFDDALQALAADLTDTMHAAGSVGLSAPQIDVLEQVLVMDHSGDQSAPEVYVNPVIVRRRGFGLVEESCVSVPGVSAFVFRASEVEVRACDVTGEPFERTLQGMAAVCLQHEMDHFDGKLVADRLNWFKRRRLRASLRRSDQLA